ncbi:MAG: hypothetical protein KF784_06810 [Fimbriimonadaceae bacterium]|nr:hypothetical protein [Fimbriimonadaceae bacterium]
MRSLFVLVFVAVACAALAVQGQLSKESKSALATLKKVDSFAVGGVGFANRISDGELALRTLIKDPAAKVALLELMKDKNMATRLYGLLGTRLVNPKAVPIKDKLEPMFKGTVPYFTGCLLNDKQNANALASRIIKGEFDAQMKEQIEGDSRR